LCYLDYSLPGRVEAIVVLLTRDRRVAGKLHATRTESGLALTTEVRYVLEAELDPNVAQLYGTGPIAQPVTDPLVREAQGWVAAGIIRIVQRWPHARDPAEVQLADMLERVPAGGEATITARPDGALAIRYSQATTRE
jgi:hypothetical protein